MADTRDLAWWFRPNADALLEYAQALDPSFVITSGFRSFAEQGRLYHAFKQGRTALPVAPPGRSFHNLGRAVDLARPHINPYADDLLPQLGALWNQAGGTWHPSDPVHFQA